FVETEHPCKFSEVVEEVIDMKVAIPESLEAMQGKPQYKQQISADYGQLRNYLTG
ncbi:MAG: threonine synthase, partial [Bacteroidetes bacterium]|nr:threonine synthase [Bacteroidota bacterium]